MFLTHWCRGKMAAISQTTFSNAFSWMKMYEFRLKFHWTLFPGVQLTIFQHWFRKWLGAGQATSHYLNQRWKVYWRIYASLGLNELKRPIMHILVVAAHNNIGYNGKDMLSACALRGQNNYYKSTVNWQKTQFMYHLMFCFLKCIRNGYKNSIIG